MCCFHGLKGSNQSFHSRVVDSQQGFYLRTFQNTADQCQQLFFSQRAVAQLGSDLFRSLGRHGNIDVLVIVFHTADGLIVVRNCAVFVAAIGGQGVITGLGTGFLHQVNISRVLDNEGLGFTIFVQLYIDFKGKFLGTDVSVYIDPGIAFC